MKKAHEKKRINQIKIKGILQSLVPYEHPVTGTLKIRLWLSWGSMKLLIRHFSPRSCNWYLKNPLNKGYENEKCWKNNDQHQQSTQSLLQKEQSLLKHFIKLLIIWHNFQLAD